MIAIYDAHNNFVFVYVFYLFNCFGIVVVLTKYSMSKFSILLLNKIQYFKLFEMYNKYCLNWSIFLLHMIAFLLKLISYIFLYKTWMLFVLNFLCVFINIHIFFFQIHIPFNSIYLIIFFIYNFSMGSRNYVNRNKLNKILMIRVLLILNINIVLIMKCD